MSNTLPLNWAKSNSWPLLVKALKSYIVFGNKCKLDIENKENLSVKILNLNKLFYTILDDHSTSKKYLSEKQVYEITKRLKVHSNISDEEKEKHVIRRKNNVSYN